MGYNIYIFQGKITKKYRINGFIITFVQNSLYMDSLSLIQSPIALELEDFKKTFDASMNSSNALLNSALDHILRKNGKMMRPILLLLTARLFGSISKEAIHAAASLELLHTASLVHDDVVDESTERRGQLSVNAIFNNKVSVLVGDFLLATSLVHSAKTTNCAIIEVIARLGQDLADGEILQLSNITNPEFSELVYFDVIRKKTAALFSSCTRAAALSTHADDKQVELAHLFGEYIGISFQIKDDIFDYFDSKELGKPTGIDMQEGKLTLPILYVLKQCKDASLHTLASSVKNGEASQQDIEKLIEAAKQGGGIEYAEAVMDEYRNKALEVLMQFPPSPTRSSLELYVNYVVDRTK